MDVYWQPWSAWWMRWPGSTSREARAYSSVVRTRSASARADVPQATPPMRANASRIAESQRGPSPVEIMVRSVTHSRFGGSTW